MEKSFGATMNATPHGKSAASSSMPLWKQGFAFCLGVLSLFLGFWLHKAFGGLTAVLGMGLFYLIAQFLLLRGNRHAFLGLASLVILNSPLVCVSIVAGGLELMRLLAVTAAFSYAGAILASAMAMWAEESRSARGIGASTRFGVPRVGNALVAVTNPMWQRNCSQDEVGAGWV